MKSWLPWQFLLRVAARRRGFIDPIEFLARLRRFAQPSEVQEPIELVRAGVLFHARGLINTKVFQYNLDWVWPFWVVRQFDPADPSFLPRAFSFSHVNLTHRNWTAVGLPGMEACPVVDPRGLVTLPDDPWSLDWWFVPASGEAIHPSRSREAGQRLEFDDGLRVTTITEAGHARLETGAWVETKGGTPRLVVEACVQAEHDGHLFLAARPANPEGVHFIEEIQLSPRGWTVNGRYRLGFAETPESMLSSTYAEGDLATAPMARAAASDGVTRCSAGMATAAAAFRVEAGARRVVRAEVGLEPGTSPHDSHGGAIRREESWTQALDRIPGLDVPDRRWRFLYEAAVRTIVLLSPGDIFPGPSTYRRFWFRDACLIMNALLATNLHARVRSAFDRFPARQRGDGYYHSQEGEWDANGQVLWIADRFEQCANQQVAAGFFSGLLRGAEWIVRKRRGPARGGLHAGLLPPGFSAEHLGPVDQYYWDDLWGVGGLRAAAAIAARHGHRSASRWAAEQQAFATDVQRSLASVPASVLERGMPASPSRRMDAGAIGSMVADYPLQLDDVVAPELALRTADWLWRRCRYAGGFFQDMIHSGINAYLTLALAQTFMRHGDPRHEGLVDTVAEIATPTGQWPEAVHPRTGGGCMGDGQHTWAAAEWILAVRAMFVREEPASLVIGAGLRARWLEEASRLAFGPTATAWGPVDILFTRAAAGWELRVTGAWHGRAPDIQVAVPGYARTSVLGNGAPLALRPLP